MGDHDDWEPLSENEMKLMQARRERSDKISKLMGDYLLKGYKMLATTCPECQTILLQDRRGTNYCVACQELDTDTGKDDPVINESAAMSMAREMELASAAAAGAGGGTNGASATSPLPVRPTKSSQSNTSPSGCGHRSVCAVPSETNGSATTLSMTSIDVQCWPPNPADIQTTAPATTAGVTVKVEPVDSDSGLGSAGSKSRLSSSTSRKTNIPSPSLPSPTSLSSSSIDVLTAKINWACEELKGTHSVEYSIQLCQLVKTASEAIVAVRSARI